MINYETVIEETYLLSEQMRQVSSEVININSLWAPKSRLDLIRNMEAVVKTSKPGKKAGRSLLARLIN